MKTLFIGFCILALFANSYGSGPYQATGIKICEVDQTSAIVWARLTKNSQRMDKSHPKPTVRYRNPETGELEPRRGRRSLKPVVLFSDNADIHTIEGAVSGTLGMCACGMLLKSLTTGRVRPGNLWILIAILRGKLS